MLLTKQQELAPPINPMERIRHMTDEEREGYLASLPQPKPPQKKISVGELVDLVQSLMP